MGFWNLKPVQVKHLLQQSIPTSTGTHILIFPSHSNWVLNIQMPDLIWTIIIQSITMENQIVLRLFTFTCMCTFIEKLKDMRKYKKS